MLIKSGEQAKQIDNLTNRNTMLNSKLKETQSELADREEEVAELKEIKKRLTRSNDDLRHRVE